MARAIHPTLARCAPDACLRFPRCPRPSNDCLLLSVVFEPCGARVDAENASALTASCRHLCHAAGSPVNLLEYCTVPTLPPDSLLQPAAKIPRFTRAQARLDNTISIVAYIYLNAGVIDSLSSLILLLQVLSEGGHSFHPYTPWSLLIKGVDYIAIMSHCGLRQTKPISRGI